MINRDGNIVISSPEPELPARTIYLVTQREANPSGAKAVRMFIEETKKFVASMPSVIPIEKNLPHQR